MPPSDPVVALSEVRHEFGEHGGVNMSIETSSTFTVMDPKTLPEIFGGRRGPSAGGCYLYGRHFNPTVHVLGRELAAMEGAQAAYAVGSGMAAVSASILQSCDRDDHVVSSRSVYGGTFALLHDYLPRKTGITTTFVDATDLEAVERAIRPNTRVLFVESVANPTLRVADIPALAELANRFEIRLVVDNTFAPLVLSPIRLGAHAVVHSLTKFIGGASDLIGGCVCGTQDWIQSMMDLHEGSLMMLGPTLDPRVAFNVSMRLPHLPLRMTEHARRAQLFAERLHELGVKVVYPGLAGHPDHALLRRDGDARFGAGGVLTLDAGTHERAETLMHTLQNDEAFGFVAVSLGYHGTLMSASASSTSSEMPEDELRAAGISPGLVRFSIGYTGDLEQRWRQLERGLRRVGLV